MVPDHPLYCTCQPTLLCTATHLATSVACFVCKFVHFVAPITRFAHPLATHIPMQHTIRVIS